jgi:hypothetical protein
MGKTSFVKLTVAAEADCAVSVGAAVSVAGAGRVVGDAITETISSVGCEAGAEVSAV